MNKPIATRTLYYVDDKSKKCNVELFAPTLDAHGCYYCKIKIEGGPEGLDGMEIAGSDSMQALLVAVECLDTMVNVFNERYVDSKLRQFENDDNYLDLGFSVQKTDSHE